MTQELLDIESTLESKIIRVISLRDYFVTVEKHGQIVVWNQSDFSNYLVIDTKVCTKYEVQTVATPDGTTNTLFIFKKMNKNTCLEITRYPNLQESSNYTQRVLEFQQAINQLNINLQSQNSIVLCLCEKTTPRQRHRTILVDVYTQDTLEQAWKPVVVWDRKFCGNVVSTVAKDRFLLINEFNRRISFYDRGVYKHIEHLGNPTSGRPLDMGRHVVFLKRKPPSMQNILVCFDAEANICQETNVFLEDGKSRVQKVHAMQMRRLDESVLLVSACTGTKIN